ncbi:MAG: transposase [Microvirga sp.]|nr:transposase [Microvirga sp.]
MWRDTASSCSLLLTGPDVGDPFFQRVDLGFDDGRCGQPRIDLSRLTVKQRGTTSERFAHHGAIYCCKDSEFDEARRNTRQLITSIQDEAASDLPATARVALQPLAAMLSEIEAEIAKLDKIGPIVASCLSASIPDASLFQGSREFAAYLGLVPRQHSTGGKPRLGSISKMGNRHLRKLLVVGAHAALYSMKSGKTKTAMADWARSLLAKKPFKVVAVALANKMARIAWAVMARTMTYEPGLKRPAARAAS